MNQSRLSVTWLESAKADVRAIDRDAALGILHCIDRYLLNGVGDVKKLVSAQLRYRLRCGDYRVFFRPVTADGILVTAVVHRREAYR